jgi:general secretion pathway protein H
LPGERMRGKRDDALIARRRGFTLIELILVIFLISLIAAMALPSFYGLSANKLKSDARRIASLLRYLNDTAISTKETYSLKFDLGEGSLSWKDSGGKKTETFEDLVSLYLPSKGEMKEGQVTIFFGPLGIQELIAVRLRKEDKGMIVTLNPWSGRTKVTPDDRSE